MKNNSLINIDVLDNIDVAEAKVNDEVDLYNTLFEDYGINLNTGINQLKIENINNWEEDESFSDWEDVLKTINVVDKKNVSKRNSLISWFLFLTKYLLTSSLIFWVLLVSTNYGAYMSLAKSYIFKWELENKEQRLISSVEASSIIEKYAEVKTKEIESKLLEEESALSIKKLIKTQDKENLKLNIEITPYENRIVIPKIWKNIPLIDIKNRNIDWQKELNNIFMKELEKWVIRYPGSAIPGKDWTTFIFWHSSNFPWIKWDYNDVFALLDKVVYDDEIMVYYWQKKYVYKIREKKVITPGDVSILERNKKKSEITLMTCRPIWTTINRLIVIWELVEKIN